MKALPLFLLLAASSVSAQPRIRTILVVGDSHSAGTFGRQLYDSLWALPNTRVAFFAVCSSGPNSWLNETEHGCGFRFLDLERKAPEKWLRTRKATIRVKGQDREVTFVKTPLLSKLLEDYKPDVTLIALGSNPTSAEGVANMLAVVHHARSACAWIGPPYMRSPPKDAVDGVYKNALVKSGVEPGLTMDETKQEGCSLIDSRSYTYLRYPEKAGDGTHYEATQDLRDLAKQWAKDAAEDLAFRLR